VLIDEVDAPAEVGEANRGLLEGVEPPEPEPGWAVDEHVGGDDGVLAVQFGALERLVHLSGDGRGVSHVETSSPAPG
jgi:hypothetical protein